jgi:hypothetical protein
MGDEDGRVEQVKTQSGASVRRVFRSHADAEDGSRQCR